MQFLDKQRSMILDDFGTVSITSLYLIMAQRTKCITYSVRLRIDCDMPEACSFNFLPWIRRYFTCLAHLLDHYTFSVCACSATLWSFSANLPLSPLSMSFGQWTTWSPPGNIVRGNFQTTYLRWTTRALSTTH